MLSESFYSDISVTICCLVRFVSSTNYSFQPAPFPPIPDVVRERIEIIVNADTPPLYGEVANLIVSSLRNDAKVLSQVNPFIYAITCFKFRIVVESYFARVNLRRFT